MKSKYFLARGGERDERVEPRLRGAYELAMIADGGGWRGKEPPLDESRMN